MEEGLGDVAETELNRMEFVAKVVQFHEDGSIQIEDQSCSVKLVFSEKNRKSLEKLDLGSTYHFYSLKKFKGNSFQFDQSYVMKEDTEKLANIEVKGKEKLITLENLQDYKHQQFIQEAIYLKVIKIYDSQLTKKNIKYQNVILADNFGSTRMTFWRENCEKTDLMEEGNVLKLKNFNMDVYNEKRNIVFVEGRTIMKTVENEDVLKNFADVDPNHKKMKGKVKFIERPFTYQSCFKCAKKWSPGDRMCKKEGCATILDSTLVVDDYNLKIIFQDEKGNMHTIQSWRKNLKEHEESGSSVMEKIQHITEKDATITYTQGRNMDEDDILEKITFS